MERSPFDGVGGEVGVERDVERLPTLLAGEAEPGRREAAVDRGGAGAARDGRAQRDVEVGREAPALEADLARREGGERREVHRRHLERQPVRRRDQARRQRRGVDLQLEVLRRREQARPGA